MAQGDDGCLKGCLIGCAGLLVLALAAGAFGYYKVVRPVQLSFERVTTLEAQSDSLRGQLEALNRAYAYEAPEEPGAVVLDGDDVERYLAVRSALADELAGLMEAREGLEESVAPDAEAEGFAMFREMFGAAFAGYEETARGRVELQRAAVDALEEQRMSPRELETLLGLVEWRFLGRDEAAFFGLPPTGREVLLEQRRTLRTSRIALRFAERFEAEIDGRSASEIRADIDRIEKEIAALQEGAGENRDLHRRTRAALDEHRAALEQLEVEGIDVLATLTEQDVMEPPMEEIVGGGRSGK